MPFVIIPTRLASQRLLDKSSVEVNYRQLVSAIGGDVYTNGTPVSTPGSLDYRNFKQDAGIANIQKQNQYAIWCIQMRLAKAVPGGGAFNGYFGFPPDVLGLESPYIGTVTSFNVIAGRIPVGTNTWATTLSKQDVNGGITTIGTTASGSNATPRTLLTNQTGLSVDMRQGENFYWGMTDPTGSDFYDIVCTIWMKSKHVR